MSSADLQPEINSIPSNEDLSKTLKDLESYSSSLASFTFHWKHINNHFSSIQKSIEKKLQQLKQNTSPENPTDKPDQADLESLCLNINPDGLKSYILAHRKGTESMRKELAPALLSSPDPTALLLDSFEGFVRSSEMTEGETQVMRRAYLTLMECFHELKLEAECCDKERARRIAAECEDMIRDGKKDNAVVMMIFLHLVGNFGLLEYFEVDGVLDVLAAVAKKKNVVELCRNSALEEKMPDLIDMLNKKGRQLDSIKFVLAFNLQHKFPPASLFKAYINESKEGLPEGATKGNNSAKLKHEVISKQITAIKAVMKAVEEYNLESQYPISSLQSRIQLLEKQRLANKRTATAGPHQPPNKRRRPSSDSSPILLPHPHSHNQSHLGLVDRTPYAYASSYELIAARPTVYGLGDPAGLGPTLPYRHSAAAAASAYYDRPVAYGGHSIPGFAYNHSPYP